MGNEEFMDELKAVMGMTEEEQNKYFEAMRPDKTSTLLVDDLAEKPQCAARDAIITRAKAFGYDDFKYTMMYGHEDILCPKVKLVEDLSKAGYEDLAFKVMEGRYD